MGGWRTSAVIGGVLAVSVLGQSGTVLASQTSSTVLTSLHSGAFLGIDSADSHTLVLGTSATQSNTDVIQTRTYTGALVKSVSLPADTGLKVYGGSTIAVGFFRGPNLDHLLLYNASTLAQSRTSILGSSLAVDIAARHPVRRARSRCFRSSPLPGLAATPSAAAIDCSTTARPA